MVVCGALGPSVAIATNDLEQTAGVYITGIAWVLPGRVHKRTLFSPLLKRKDI